MAGIYSNLKIFNFVDGLDDAPYDKITNAPVHVRIKPINACNHKCWFCCFRADNLDLGTNMSLRDRIPYEKMKEIVKDLIEMKVQAVTFSGGGEPLIFPKLNEIIRDLSLGGIKIGTLSNGSKLTGIVADAFADYGTWIRVSMNGWNAESYGTSRGVDEFEFSKVLTNMSEFAKRKSKCSLGVSYIISEENAPHIYNFCKMIKDVGVEHIKLSACVVGNTAQENNIYHSKFSRVVAEQIALSTQLNDAQFTVANHYHEMEERFEKNYGHCHIAHLLTIIGADCRVYTCQDKAYTDSGLLGSIKETSFKEFWFSDQNRDRLNGLNPRTACSHHCVSHRKNQMLQEFKQLNREHIGFV